MIKCIIFDNDGTLVDSEYLSNVGLQIKLKEYGVDSLAEELTKQFRGAKLANTLHTVESTYDIKLKDNFVQSYRALVGTLFEKDLKPCEGVYEALEVLKENKLPMCVASSGPLEKINATLSITGLSKFFTGNIFSAYEINSWKPDPGIFLHAAKQMGFDAKECVVVEDSLVGIAAAKAAGMYPILYDPENLFDKDTSPYIIHQMNELEAVISRLELVTK